MQRAKSAVEFSSLLNPPDLSFGRDSDPRMAVDNIAPEFTGLSEEESHLRRAKTDDERLLGPADALKPNGSVSVDPVEQSNEPPRPYKCPLCEKAFHRLEHQTRHIRTHTGEKPHHCQYPGCPKRFSRSDELTRHSRIHSNPNSRRGNKNPVPVGIPHQGVMGPGMHHGPPPPHVQQPLPLQPGLSPAMVPPSVQDGGIMLPPPMPRTIRSAPTSTVPSPDVSPPHSFSPHAHQPSNLGPYPRNDISMLARAANQVERESTAPIMAPQQQQHHAQAQRYPVPYYQHHHHQPFPQPFNHRQAYLSALHVYKNPGPEDADDHYNNGYRQPKRSRPNSPSSTAPSSPTLSHDSLSPTPDHTPLATPAHSPRLRPYPNYELPSLRSLTLQPLNMGVTPTLPPLEPTLEAPVSSMQYLPPPNITSAPRSSHMSLSNIMNQPDPAQRKLPLPKVAVQDMLSADPGMATPRHHTAPSSIAVGDLVDRA
jgi:zinc finger protein CreA/MIG